MTSLKCPHCQSSLKTRSSRAIAPFAAQTYLTCGDVECGATFGGDLSITHEISPSGKPNPDVRLRKVSPRRPANDEAPTRHDGVIAPRAANDDEIGASITVPR